MNYLSLIVFTVVLSCGLNSVRSDEDVDENGLHQQSHQVSFRPNLEHKATYFNYFKSFLDFSKSIRNRMCSSGY